MLIKLILLQASVFSVASCNYLIILTNGSQNGAIVLLVYDHFETALIRVHCTAEMLSCQKHTKNAAGTTCRQLNVDRSLTALTMMPIANCNIIFGKWHQCKEPFINKSFVLIYKVLKYKHRKDKEQ